MARTSGKTDKTPVTKPTVLVVDDEPFMKDLLSRVLGEKYRVLAAESVLDADRQLAGAEVQVILCDYLMPGEDGLSFLKRIGKAMPMTQCILLTGNSSPELMMNALNEARLFKFLTKPVELDDLQKTVGAAFREHDRQKEVATLAASAREESRQHHRWWQRFTHWSIFMEEFADRTTGLATKISMILILGVIVAVALGLLGFAALYMLKSFFGFDLFETLHLHDVIQR